ncbi:MAG TPA: acyl-CoA dehydrogenase family protein, partial [Caulobacteraceae bacterium]|nr:acyl-CoA dehydrogenase family protein [Caulobacteraceae bacterium]
AHVAAAAGDAALVERITTGEALIALAVREDFGAPTDTLGKRRLYESAGATAALAIDGDEVWLLDIADREFAARPCLDSSISMTVADLSDSRVICRLTDSAIGLRGALLLAAYQVGIAEKALEMIVDYAKIRQTFGRPIGAYQAVRHPCAEMSTRAEEAKALVYLASVSLSDGARDAPLQISAGRVLAEKAALQNADDNIQLHGGIGVTEEFDAHHLIKRATVSPQWFGDRRSHLARVLATPINVDGAS